MTDSFFWGLDQLDPVTRRVVIVALLTLITVVAGCVLAIINNVSIYLMLLMYAILLMMINEPIKAQAWLVNGLDQKTTIRNIAIGAAVAEMVVFIGLALP